MGVLINSSGGAPFTIYTYVKLSHCALNCHTVHFKYVTILLVNYPSIRLGDKDSRPPRQEYWGQCEGLGTGGAGTGEGGAAVRQCEEMTTVPAGCSRHLPLSVPLPTVSWCGRQLHGHWVALGNV